MLVPRQEKYLALGRYHPDDILPYVGPDAPRKDFTHGGVTFNVKMSSARMVCFALNHQCVCCGVVGEAFLLELPLGSKKPIPHFNLYGLRGSDWVQMTKDHIVPRSKGGRDNQENLQTMCSRCNEAKADHVLTLDQVRELVTA